VGQLVLLATLSRYLSYRVDLSINVFQPKTNGDATVNRRIDTSVGIELLIRPLSMDEPLSWDSILVQKTNSVHQYASLDLRRPIGLVLEVQDAKTGMICKFACPSCHKREHRKSLANSSPIIDWKSPTDLVELKEGQARLKFNFLCYSNHHGDENGEFRYVVTPSSKCALTRVKNQSLLA
jgi:hypothetical protein